MSHGHASSPGQRSLATAVLVTCGILTLGWMVHQRYYSHHDPSPPIRATGGAFSANNGISIYLLQRTGVKNTQGQRRAHYVMLLAIAAVAGLAALRKPLVAWRCPDFLWPVLGTAAATAIAAFLIWSAKRQTYPGWYYAVGAAVAVLLGWFGSRWCAARRNRAFGMLAVLSLLVFCGPTLFMQLDHSYRSWQVVELMEAHYTALFSPANRLANGARPGDEVGVLYGMLMPLLVAVGERYVGDLSLRGHVILVNILQVAYLAAAAYGYYLYGRRRWFLALLPILLVGVHYHFYNEFLDRASPNHTAWRTIARAAELPAVDFFPANQPPPRIPDSGRRCRDCHSPQPGNRNRVRSGHGGFSFFPPPHDMLPKAGTPRGILGGPFHPGSGPQPGDLRGMPAALLGQSALLGCHPG